jgi:hypothetical protein
VADVSDTDSTGCGGKIPARVAKVAKKFQTRFFGVGVGFPGMT